MWRYVTRKTDAGPLPAAPSSPLLPAPCSPAEAAANAELLQQIQRVRKRKRSGNIRLVLHVYRHDIFITVLMCV